MRQIAIVAPLPCVSRLWPLPRRLGGNVGARDPAFIRASTEPLLSALASPGRELCAVVEHLPDHEPALGNDLATAHEGWVSGHGLARGASLLIHDCQYAESEYPARRGWGHSSLPDALAFAHRCDAQRVLLVHHDPWHDDAFLEALDREASEGWSQRGGEGRVELGREGRVFDLAAAA